jgi:hypothetical protein
MNRTAFRLVFVLVLAAPVILWPRTPGPSIAYFTNLRQVHISQPSLQNYFVVDEELWNWARSDLADLRIYDDATQVQYALSEQRGGASGQEEPARILNLGDLGGHPEFDLDMGQIGEYDRIRLQLDARNFVVTASIAGSSGLGRKPATQLPLSTLYDFTREELGSNSVMKLPTSSFPYLHIKLSAGISPQQVKGATVYNLQETKTIWTNVGSCGAASQRQRTTVITCAAPPKVPLDRMRFQIDPGQVNFRRTVSISDAQGLFTSSGQIGRVRLNRAGTTVVSEEMDVPIAGRSSGPLTITVDNADNPPLAITGMQLLSVERRVYFDPRGKPGLKLYYGDDGLSQPIYDYARFFKADPAAAQAELGPGAHNEAYRGRPDDRPWSERHQAILWLAMLVTVAVLAVLAVRGLKAEAAD